MLYCSCVVHVADRCSGMAHDPAGWPVVEASLAYSAGIKRYLCEKAQ
ncbi:MAG: hypothetical protein ACRC6F_09730 [Aeromonas sp.]